MNLRRTSQLVLVALSVLLALFSVNDGHKCHYFSPRTECDFVQNTDHNKWKIKKCDTECCNEKPSDNVFSVCINPEARGGGATFSIIPPEFPVSQMTFSFDLCQLYAETQVYIRYKCKPEVPVQVFYNSSEISPMMKFNLTAKMGCHKIAQVDFFGYLMDKPKISKLNIDELCYDFTECGKEDPCPVRAPKPKGCTDKLNCPT